MYNELGREANLTDGVIDEVIKALKERLDRARSGNFIPNVSYSSLAFDRTDNGLVSPWGQAFSLLSDIVAFPRKALTDSFFFRGLKVASEEDFVDAMNVADDDLCRNRHARNIKDRCRSELTLLATIEKADIAAKERCNLLWQILDGISVDQVEENLARAQAAAKAEREAGPSASVRQ